MTTKTMDSHIQLRWGDKKKRVVVIPEDEDRFILTVEAAIRACNVAVEYSAFMPVFRNLLTRLGEWTRQYKKQILDAYLTVRDAELMFVVVKKTREYDREFEDLLTSLDIRIAQDKDFEMINLSVFGLPKSPAKSVAAFLSPQNTLKYNKNA